MNERVQLNQEQKKSVAKVLKACIAHGVACGICFMCKRYGLNRTCQYADYTQMTGEYSTKFRTDNCAVLAYMKREGYPGPLEFCVANDFDGLAEHVLGLTSHK